MIDATGTVNLIVPQVHAHEHGDDIESPEVYQNQMNYLDGVADTIRFWDSAHEGQESAIDAYVAFAEGIEEIRAGLISIGLLPDPAEQSEAAH